MKKITIIMLIIITIMILLLLIISSNNTQKLKEIKKLKTEKTELQEINKQNVNKQRFKEEYMKQCKKGASYKYCECTSEYIINKPIKEIFEMVKEIEKGNTPIIIREAYIKCSK